MSNKTSPTADETYAALIHDVLNNGEWRPNRTGTPTLAVFGRQCRFDLRTEFPLLTTKKVHIRSIVAELLWFLSGDNRVSTLEKQGVTIWNEWQLPDGTIGRGYGVQWRDWHSVDEDGSTRITDQIDQLITGLRMNPFGRRHLVSAWNPGELSRMALPPCHLLFQCHVHPAVCRSGRPGLSLQLYQRSADLGLGVPFNIASYAILTRLIAQVCNLEPRDLIYDLGDLHIYENHVQALTDQVKREGRTPPTLWVNPRVREITAFVPDDIRVLGYDPHPAVRMSVAV